MHRSPRLRSTDRPAFTLIELLVVIGIIVLLVGLLLGGLVHARKSAAHSRMVADLALIGTALDEYKTTFGDYPRFTLNNSTDMGAATASGNGKWLDERTDRGAVLLCRCLLGPGPAGKVTQSYANAGDDGADGLGFRATRNVTTYGTNDQFTGNVYGPLIQSDKFPVGGTKDADNFQDAVLLDPYGNPILYYPALPTHGTLAGTAGAFVAKFDPTATASGNQMPLYNTYDNLQPYGAGMTTTYLSTAEMQYILGNRATPGTLAATETPTTTAPYILWTAGPDGIYGRSLDGKTDDITNFDMPTDLAK